MSNRVLMGMSHGDLSSMSRRVTRAVHTFRKYYCNNEFLLCLTLLLKFLIPEKFVTFTFFLDSRRIKIPNRKLCFVSNNCFLFNFNIPTLIITISIDSFHLIQVYMRTTFFVLISQHIKFINFNKFKITKKSLIVSFQ